MNRQRPVYLDSSATTEVDPSVLELVIQYLRDEYGNAGSRTHEYGAVAKKAVLKARRQVADVLSAAPEELVFTSGATESNNLAILGLAAHGEASGRKHIISSQIEHKAVLEPLEHLQSRGFEVELVPPTRGGWVEADDVVGRVREDTLLLSIMHQNNETGIVQPIDEIAGKLGDSAIFFHTDAAQSFGKAIEPLRNERIDLVSVSGHKVCGPMGIGALLTRRRGWEKLPLEPLMFGGGQERGLRPGTQPVPLIAGLGFAAELALKQHAEREKSCKSFKAAALSFIESVGGQIVGDPARLCNTAVSFYIDGLDSEAMILLTKSLVAISTGSACTSESIEPSHVLLAMGLSEDISSHVVRMSWSHNSKQPDWFELRSTVEAVSL